MKSRRAVYPPDLSIN